MYKIFKGREELFDRIVDVLTFIFAAIVFLAADAGGVTKDTMLIPTITNGLTATTSIAIAGTGVVLAFAHNNKLFLKRTRPWASRIYYTFAFLLMAMAFVGLANFALMWGDYEKAVRTAMAGLIIAFAIFANFTFFISRRYVEPVLQ
jgi:hypothetical protein